MSVATLIGGYVQADDRRSRWCRRLVSFPALPEEVRRRLLRAGGVDLDPRVWGLERCWFQSPRISIGPGTYLNAGCWLEGSGEIRIGAGTMLGPEVLVLTSTHARRDDGSVSSVSDFRATTIGDNCWLGARTIVLPGISIADGTVTGAGAVVTRDTEPGGTYAGVPARRIA